MYKLWRGYGRLGGPLVVKKIREDGGEGGWSISREDTGT